MESEDFGSNQIQCSKCLTKEHRTTNATAEKIVSYSTQILQTLGIILNGDGLYPKQPLKTARAST